MPLNPPRLSRQSQHVDIVSFFSFCCWVFICVRFFVDMFGYVFCEVIVLEGAWLR